MAKFIPGWGLLGLLPLCLILAGCQGPAPPKLVPVRGHVQYRQRPVKGATICFIPDITNGNREGLQATGQTGEDGSFTLQTYPHGEGAMVGSYKVICIVFGGITVPQKYRNPTLTPLAAVVKEPGIDHLVFALAD
jgi:hypothetical protein